MKKITLPVSGMHCASCASTIERKLEKLDGVGSCVVNYGTEKAQVSYDPDKVTVAQMNAQIDTLGYSLVDTEAKKDTSMSGMDHSVHEGYDMMTPTSTDSAVKERKLKELAQLKRYVLIMTPMIVVSLFMMSLEAAASLRVIPPIPSPVSVFLHHLLPIFATYALFVVGIPYLRAVVRFARYGVANMDTLVGIGTLVAFLFSFILSAFEVVLKPYIDTSQSYYDVTIVVIGFITLGKYLEARSKLKTGEAIEELIGLQAKTALVIRNNEQVEVPIEQVTIGDIVVVKPGQKIPLDGVITEGSSAIDESMITGEAIPVDKSVGDLVIGATMNKQGSLQVKVTKVGSDTMLAQIIAMVEEAQGSKAPIERMADRVSAVFVPIVLVIAIVTLLIWVIVGSYFMPVSQAVTLGILSFVGVLVIACPCAMGLATPTAIIVGVGRAAQSGILIKNAQSLETTDGVDFMVMDKTGTLTRGQPKVTDIVSTSVLTEREVLAIAGSLEQLSEHPIGQAIVDEAKRKNVEMRKVNDFSVIEGKGLKGKLKVIEYFVGNLKLANDLAHTVNGDTIQAFTSQAKTPVLVMTKDGVIAYIAIADTVKDGAPETVTRLHELGIKIAMLTGDHTQTAEHFASQLGIDRVIAEVLPEDKAREIRKLQSEGYTVAMVGDGINDAPALAMADVGIAMGTGTDVAIESAGITLLGGTISKVSKAVTLARATMRIVKENLFWAFFYNIICIPIAAGLLYPFFGILLTPAIAGAAMALSSVSVVVNSLRLKQVRI